MSKPMREHFLFEASTAALAQGLPPVETVQEKLARAAEAHAAAIKPEHGTDWRTRAVLVKALTDGKVREDLTRQDVRNNVKLIAKAESQIAKRKARDAARQDLKSRRRLKKLRAAG